MFKNKKKKQNNNAALISISILFVGRNVGFEFCIFGGVLMVFVSEFFKFCACRTEAEADADGIVRAICREAFELRGSSRVPTTRPPDLTTIRPPDPIPIQIPINLNSTER